MISFPQSTLNTILYSLPFLSTKMEKINEMPAKLDKSCLAIENIKAHNSCILKASKHRPNRK